MGVAFWLREDLSRVLDSWGRRVSVADFRIVVVPRWGDPWPLEEQLGSVIGAPNGLLRLPRRANASPGGAEVEVVRRLGNAQVGLKENHRLYLAGVLRRFEDRPMKPVRLPRTERSWVRARSAWGCLIRAWLPACWLARRTDATGRPRRPSKGGGGGRHRGGRPLSPHSRLSAATIGGWAKLGRTRSRFGRSRWGLASGLRMLKFRKDGGAHACRSQPCVRVGRPRLPEGHLAPLT